MSAPMAIRRPRKSVVVLAGSPNAPEQAAHVLTDLLRTMGIDTCYLGRESSPRRIAAAVVEEQADAVELCLAGGAGVRLLRELLHELTSRDRRDVSIVVHRA
jgi:methylmalonyl-CoA mutase cobalamin-binding domain/chain